MNFLWNFSTILLIFIVKIGARLVIVPDERFQPCDGSKEIGPGEKLELNGFVYDAEYILLDDLNVIVNGTYTFKTNVNAPWSVRVIGEKFERGKWTQRVVKNMYDACYDFFNPMDIFYTNFKTFQRCPYKKGDQWIANEMLMDFSVVTFPSMYYGRWRFKIEMNFTIGGVKVTDCSMIYGDLENGV